MSVDIKSKEKLKELCTGFFSWWHNRPGHNTGDDFEDWYEINKSIIESKEADGIPYTKAELVLALEALAEDVVQDAPPLMDYDSMKKAYKIAFDCRVVCKRVKPSDSNEAES